ncbi:MAG: cobaltochelatase subunit CobN [Candidatus Methanomethylophilaceae archaeon]|nr:cobaltochelatase subunit CobN [Candidatus Methanomethylophilaceae archaeon]
MDLDESENDNYPRTHVIETMSDGADEEEARTRLFSNGPGCGSGGIYLAILASAWKDDKDLVDYYLNCKGYGYGGDRKGRPMLRQFARMLSRNDITFDKVHSDSVDILSSGRYSGFGGMVNASKYLSGKEVRTYYGDTSNPLSVPVRSFSEEVERVTATKVLNPQWIEAMKGSGYSGANEMTKRITRMFGWQCATKEVDGKVFDGITDRYVRDEETYAFLRENNVYSAGELVRRLLEAHERGLWNASDEDLELLQDRFLELESDLESLAGEGEYQGSSIDVYSYDSLPEWEARMKEAGSVSEELRSKAEARR